MKPVYTEKAVIQVWRCGAADCRTKHRSQVSAEDCPKRKKRTAKDWELARDWRRKYELLVSSLHEEGMTIKKLAEHAGCSSQIMSNACASGKRQLKRSRAAST